MVTQADKTKENKSKATSNNVTKDKNRTASDFQFEDNRPEAIAQRKMQEMVESSPQARQIAQLTAITKGQTMQKVEDEELMQGKFEAVQRQEEEEKLMQGKFETVQRQEEEELQMKSEPNQKKPNNTGLPDNLKTGVENLSGISLDDVKVHYNSDKPSQLQAHAFAQGTDIHMAPGQEKHLPHEAWHVVQQKQGRVKPTMQLKGKVNVNDDPRLEKEADVMGEQAFQFVGNRPETVSEANNKTDDTIQRVYGYRIKKDDKKWLDDKKMGPGPKEIVKDEEKAPPIKKWHLESEAVVTQYLIHIKNKKESWVVNPTEEQQRQIEKFKLAGKKLDIRPRSLWK